MGLLQTRGSHQSKLSLGKLYESRFIEDHIAHDELIVESIAGFYRPEKS